MGTVLIRVRFSPCFLARREKRGSEFFVEGEEVLDALAVAFKGLRAVRTVNGAVEVGMGFDQRRRHRQRVVKVSERRVGGFFARVQDRLRCHFYSRALFVSERLRPRKIIIDKFV